MSRPVRIAASIVLLMLPVKALAHVSEGGFVLLLPTGAYSAAGVAVVALTILALIWLPDRAVRSVFSYRSIALPQFSTMQMVVSLISTILLFTTIWIGLTGPRDPLSNLMSLGFWSFYWIALVSLAGVFGNFWRWINPWSGIYQVMGAPKPMFQLPGWLGQWPTAVILVAFAGFLLADIAPDDPARVARFVAIYWALTMLGVVIFGEVWLSRVELGHAIFRAYGALAPLKTGASGGLGGPGWRVLTGKHHAGAGVFALLLLAVGSFDGINETFWWLAQIGVNPLEFPGRSAVVAPTLLGLILSCLGLLAVFALVILLGRSLAQIDAPFAKVFATLALSTLPIALVYHIAHYFTSFLVSSQYLLAAVSDPFATGADWLGIQPFRVTTGFFNSIDTVRLIWVTQASLVVLGHVWSVLLSHRMALDLCATRRQVLLLTAPLSAFMVAYTFLGLWLLAAPKGA